MDWRVETHVDENHGATVEVATMMHEGKPYTALGSVIDIQNGIIYGYIKNDPSLPSGRFLLTTFESKVLCPIHRLSTWKTPRSWISGTMSSWRCEYLGRKWLGRSGGAGLLIRLRAHKDDR